MKKLLLALSSLLTLAVTFLELASVRANLGFGGLFFLVLALGILALSFQVYALTRPAKV